MSPVFLLRWSLRDLRRRWLQVAAVALVLAIGTGVFAALSGTATWRRVSNDASFAATGMYDLRVRATEGLDADRGALLAALDRLPDPGLVAHAEERLVVDVQVDASRADESIRVPGRLVGLDVAAGGPQLTSVAVATGDGRGLGAADDGGAVAVLERNFADYYELEPSATVRLGAGDEVEVVGLGMAPEYFFITTEDGGFFAQANFAALFTSLTTAQQLADRPGRVNDLVVRLRDGADVEDARRAVQAVFDASSTGIGATVMVANDEDAYRALYDDIDSDRRFWNVFAGLVLAGAAFAAFNLASRLVDAQRRELGIGMALGASPLQLAWRPVLVGVEIGVAGTLLGIVVGWSAVTLLRPVYTEMLPLPVWITDFQWRPFAQAAALAFAIPVVATLWPVWRAVRMTPVDAIATVHRSSRSGWSHRLRVLPWPHSAFRRMPLGNVLRAPRRTMLTALGIGAAVAALVAVLGLLDSFRSTMDRNESIVLADHPDRVVVGLDAVVAEDGALVSSVAAADSVGAVSPVLQIPGHLAVEGREGFDVVVEAIDLVGGLWSPLAADAAGDPPVDGVVIGAPAASDLGLEVGDLVDVTHPARVGTGFTTVTTPLRVIAVHPSPFRFQVYVDRSLLGSIGAAGLTNELSVVPADGSTVDDVERELFDLAGINSVVPAAASSQIVRDSLDEFTGILRVLEAFMLLLALLIAYNATSINADERRRERATLFAFGLAPWRVVQLEVAECLAYGVLGTAVGVVVGRWIHRWMTTSLLQATMPEMRLDVVVGTGTNVAAVVVGVLAVAVAPLLTVRRLRRMDVPGTLRVVE